MGRKHKISREYPVGIETLWADILDASSLADSMKGAVSYEGLPVEPVYEGQVIVVKLKRWGWFPLGKWTMEVVRRDDAEYILESREHGGIVKCYRHRLEVVPTGPDSCRYTDTLDLDAGWLTPLVLPTFKKLYEQRHDQRIARLIRK